MPTEQEKDYESGGLDNPPEQQTVYELKELVHCITKAMHDGKTLKFPVNVTIADKCVKVETAQTIASPEYPLNVPTYHDLFFRPFNINMGTEEREKHHFEIMQEDGTPFSPMKKQGCFDPPVRLHSETDQRTPAK